MAKQVINVSHLGKEVNDYSNKVFNQLKRHLDKGLITVDEAVFWFNKDIIESYPKEAYDVCVGIHHYFYK